MTDGMYRRQMRRNFTQISNEAVNDPALSWKAKGVLLYLASKPDNWQARTSDIVAHGLDGSFAVTSAFKELCAAGYMRRLREKDDRGQYVTITEYADWPRWAGNDGEPDAESASGLPADPHAESASGPHAETAAPHTRKSRVVHTRKSRTSNTEYLTNTETNTEGTNTERVANRRALSAAQVEAWRPDEELARWTRETNPALTKVDLEQWRDHHVAAGTKIKDPAASWRTWVRNSLKFGAVNGTRQQRPSNVDAANAAYLADVELEEQASRSGALFELGRGKG